MKRVPVEPPSKHFIITRLVACIIGMLLFIVLIIINNKPENTLLVTGLWAFLGLHIFGIVQSVYRLKKYKKRNSHIV